MTVCNGRNVTLNSLRTQQWCGINCMRRRKENTKSCSNVITHLQNKSGNKGRIKWMTTMPSCVTTTGIENE